MAKQQLIINDFSGGLNTKLAPHLIPDNQCVDMANVDTETGILEAIKGRINKGAIGQDHFALLSNTANMPYSTIPMTESFTYTQSLNSMYTVETSSYVAGGQVKLWWQNPSSSGLQSTTNLTLPAPTNVAHQATRAWVGYEPGWTIQYALTAYDEARGIESPPVYVEVTINSTQYILGGGSETGATDATASNISGTGVILRLAVDASNTEADKVKVYRLGKLLTFGSELTEYRYIGEMDVSAYGTFLYFFDGTPSENAGEVLATANLDIFFNLNASYKCLELHSGRLFVAESFMMRLRYSGAGSLGAFENNAYLDLSGRVTGMASALGGMYIFTADGRFSYLTGTSPADFNLTTLGYNTDCIHPSTIAKGKGFIIWLSKHGIMRASGYSIQNLTHNTFIDLPDAPTDGNWEYYGGALINESYYFMTSINTLYKFDMTQNAISKITIAGLTQVFPYNNRLYGNISNSHYELFSTTPVDSWEWTSKEYSGQSYDSEVEWESYKIAYIGEPTVEVFIDGISVLTLTSLNSATRKTDKVLLPSATNQGLTIQFKVSGSATTKVYSLRSIYNYINLEN